MDSCYLSDLLDLLSICFSTPALFLSSSYARLPHESKGIPWPSCYPPYPQLPPRGSSLNTPQDGETLGEVVLDAASLQISSRGTGLGMARCTFCFPAPWRPVVDCYSLMSFYVAQNLGARWFLPLTMTPP